MRSKVFRYSVEKIVYWKKDVDDKSKWDYEVSPKVFHGTLQPAIARAAEQYMSRELRDRVLDATAYGKLIEEDPSGIHHCGCDEITFEFEEIIVILKVVRLTYN